MSGRFRPYRRFRSEIFSLALAVAVPFVLIAVFPLPALKTLPPAPPAATAPACAFVTLTPEEERRALASARAAWQIDRDGFRRVRIDLFADSLPECLPPPVFDAPVRSGAGDHVPAAYVPDPLPPTLAAPPPVTIAPQPEADPTTFSREELLKID